MTAANAPKIEKLQQAIEALEEQRAVLGDVVVDASIEAIQNQLSDLEGLDEEVAQQRKLATILFCDIVGSTQLVQALDPEDNLAIMDGALVRFAGEIETHGGRIARFQGDGFKAIFGVPNARESDPANAIRAGLEVIGAAKDYESQLRMDWNISRFEVRVGIATGLVVVGGAAEAEDAIVGMIVNLAARLESAAPPGSLLISQHTYQHVRGVFDVEPLEPILAKGFPEPVPVYLVKGAKPRAFHLDTRGVEGIETKTIGRDNELAQLQMAYQTAVVQNQTTIVTIVGEAGVGKSRLLYEFENRLQRQSAQIQTFRGRASQRTQGIAQYLLRDVLATRFQILDSDSLDIVRNKFVAGLVEFLGDEGEVKAHILGTRLGYDFGDSPHLQSALDNPGQIKNRADGYLADFFDAVSVKSPTVLLLEDVHWADGGSLDTLVQLVQQRPQLPLLIVCLARPSLYQRQAKWGEKFPIQTRLELAPLSAAAGRALVAEILRRIDPLPPALLDLVSSRAEGNPFYAEELVKMLIDEGTIVTSAEAWQVAPEQLHDLKVPDTLTGVLQARLDRLGGAEKLAVQQASVIGRIFWDDALEALRDEGHLELPVLEAKEFIFTRLESSFAGTMEYIFKHALLRDVTYETVLRRLRREYHALIAQWIEQNASERLGEFSGLIAEHYTLAEQYNLASTWWDKSGDIALRTGDFVAAQNAFERALDPVPESDPLRMAELERKLAAALSPVQGAEKAEMVYRSALARLEGPVPTAVYTQWQTVRLNILLGLMDAIYFQHRPEAMAELDEQTQALLNEVGTAKQQSDYFSRLGQMVFLQNRYRSSTDNIQWAQKSLAYARQTQDVRIIARQHFHVGFHLLWQRNLEGAAAMFHEALATAKESEDSWLEIQCLVYLTISLRFRGGTSQMAALLPNLADTAQRVGYLGYIGVSQANSAWLHYRALEWQQAQAQAKEALASWADAGYPFEWLAHWILLAISLQQKRKPDAVAAARAMLDPEQQQLENDLQEVLRTAAAAWDANDEATTHSNLVSALELASMYGYL